MRSIRRRVLEFLFGLCAGMIFLIQHAAALSSDQVFGEVTGSVTISAKSVWNTGDGGRDDPRRLGNIDFHLTQRFNHTPLVDTTTFDNPVPEPALQSVSGKSTANYHSEFWQSYQAPYGICTLNELYDETIVQSNFDAANRGGSVTLVRGQRTATSGGEFQWYVRVKLFDGVSSNHQGESDRNWYQSGPCGGKDVKATDGHVRYPSDFVVKGTSFVLPVDLSDGKPLHISLSLPFGNLKDLPSYSEQEYPEPQPIDAAAYFNSVVPSDPLMNGESFQDREKNALVSAQIDITIEGWAIESTDMLKAINFRARNSELANTFESLDVQGADANFVLALVWLKKNYPDIFPRNGQKIELTFVENIQDDTPDDSVTLGYTDVDSREITLGFRHSVAEYVDTLSHELLHSRMLPAKSWFVRHFMDEPEEHTFIYDFAHAVAAHYTAWDQNPDLKRSDLAKTDAGWPMIEGNNATISHTLDGGAELPYDYHVRSLYFQSEVK